MEDVGLNLDLVKEYSNANDALSYLEQLASNSNEEEWPAVIIVDINMPEMTGWEFIEAFAKLPKQSTVPKIYLVTHSISPKDAEKLEITPLATGLNEKYLDEAFFKMLIEEQL